MNPLDNIFWYAMAGPQARFAVGAGAARRFAAGFSPIVAFENASQPDFDALRPFCEAGEKFYCAGWSGPAVPGWTIEAEGTMFKMVWQGRKPAADEAPQAVLLGPPQADQAMALATLTRPGPFGPRTIELGDYFGCFDGERLVAMAGERTQAPGLREISGVCTHPDHQGRGLARRLMHKLIRQQVLRGETPYLHVMSDNTAAHALYARMGFVDFHEVVVRVVSRTAPA